MDCSRAVEYDTTKIAACNVMRTPTLEIGGQVVLAGRVPTVTALTELLQTTVA